ncbi:MAG: Crp/Fnr family transcriptional regulator [Muribaculaceae bacterium]|nr:Crp/Fnr family transcriptional regulator [Muribaculaceae bacterium]
MKRHFNTHIEGIDLEFWHELIENHGHYMTVNAGDYITRIGEPTSVVGFVKTGYLIYGTSDFDNKMTIGGFTFPEALFGDYPSCLHNEPAAFNIIAGRRCEVCVMDATKLLELYESSADICRHGRLFMESAYKSLRDRYYDIYSKTPVERYLDLMNRHPQIQQDVPQREIALYLRITPIHLCRIRKELMLQ